MKNTDSFVFERMLTRTATVGRFRDRILVREEIDFAKIELEYFRPD